MSLKKILVYRICKYIPDKLWLQIKFLCRMGRFPNLKDPQTFNEKIQWLKLHNRKPEFSAMVDKYEVKKLIAEQIGEEYLIPTLGVWDKIEEVDFDTLPNQFVIKCTHDSGGLVICKNKQELDLNYVKKNLKQILKKVLVARRQN